MKQHNYNSRGELAEALAISVAGVLAGGIATRGEAVLAVSGGSTPKLFFSVLSQCDLDWSKVTVLLVDERIVPADNDRANAKLVRENLCVNKAATANLVLYEVDHATPEECASMSARNFGNYVHHIDALILGMGTDGHTASFFPNGDNLAAALDLNGDKSVISMRAEGAGESRLTLTLPVVLSAHFLALHIEGDEKMAVFQATQIGTDENEMPVRAVLKNAKLPINLFWAP